MEWLVAAASLARLKRLPLGKPMLKYSLKVFKKV
jgi:hypothetical protein